MMIDALIAGKIYGTPKSGTGKSGADYVNAMVRVATPATRSRPERR